MSAWAEKALDTAAAQDDEGRTRVGAAPHLEKDRPIGLDGRPVNRIHAAP